MEEQIQFLAKLLVDNGLDYAFGVTGSGPSLALITELERLGVRYYPASHEASAALMAGAVCRTTGRISVSISIKGPGLANMLPGIVHNHFESIPALSISEAFGVGSPSYRKHKRLDHFALLSSVVKGIIALNDIDRQLIAQLQFAQSEVSGPVHLELCDRDSEQSSTVLLNRGNALSSDKNGRGEVFRRLHSSERPIVIVGSLASRRGWKEELAFLNIPVFTTVSAKGALDETLGHSAGVFTGDGKELAPESHLFEEADLVIGIGLRNTEVLSPKPFGMPTVIVDEVKDDLADGFQADVLLTGVDPELVSTILFELREKFWGRERIDSLRRTMQNTLLKATWLPAGCFDLLNRLSFPHTLVLDTGSFCTIGEHLWQAGPGRFFIGSGNSRYMGVAIPSAVGAAICKSELPVFCVVGDGGMRTYPAEIKLAVEDGLPACFILMRDGRYGSIACIPQHTSMSSRPVTILQPSWWKTIEAMGCETSRVTSEGAFEAVIQSWERKGPLFIEATFDPEAYASMTSRLR